MKTLLLGVCRDLSATQLHNWASSSFKLDNTDTHLICLDQSLSSELLDLCHDNTIKLIHIPDNSPHVHYVRYHHAWRYLKDSNFKDLSVLWTDTADVVFQCQNLDWLHPWTNNLYVVGSEGVTYNQEPWNCDNLRKSFPKMADSMQTQEIACSGVIAGSPDRMIDLFFLIYNLSKDIDHDGVDQSSLNVIMTTSIKDKFAMTNTDEDKIVHCAVSGPTEFFKGWGFDKSYKYHTPKLLGNQVVNYKDEPFAIVHQYNRIPDWKKAIDSLYV